VAESKAKSSVRLYTILARKAPLAVVFRRGPSKSVLLIKWRTDTDEFDEGQWLKGRIYERRCDLSPGGKRLIYFAANFKKPYYSWTAISKPPFLAAIALWPKGDGWGGGGLFANDKKILLNHRDGEMELAAGFNLPRFVKVEPFGARPGWGEDSPILDARLTRDGWRLVQDGKTTRHKMTAPVWIEVDPPQIWSRMNPNQKTSDYELRALTRGIYERNGAWYVMEHVVQRKKPTQRISLGKTDWADWCHSGDLLFSREGKIFRLGFDQSGELLPLAEARMVIDLTDKKFEARKAPEVAKVWGST
jgi:hypothetical protein